VTRITRSVVAALMLAVSVVASAQDATTAAKKAARPSIYDAKADAAEQVKAATVLARRDARRVLVMFGGDWCGWCHKLHGLFGSDPAIRELLADEYVLVMVDTKAPHADALLEECRGDLTTIGYPFLAVLDGEGKVVTRQRTDSLEEGDHHDPAKVKAFLEEWAAPKVAASKTFEEGLAKASSEDKLVFLHFGSPTCGWCHKLDAFLAREDMAPIIGRQFVDVKLDLARMTGADEILKKYNAEQSGGIPWFVFLDAKGNAIATSHGPKGNIGYPATPEEIEHFIGMLKKAARKLEPVQIEAVEEALKSEARTIEAARARAGS
jgi:uncharacterized protein YyaL (SSP411 family)